MDVWQVIIGVGLALLVGWLALVVTLWWWQEGITTLDGRRAIELFIGQRLRHQCACRDP
jgi:hypothetical protein